MNRRLFLTTLLAGMTTTKQSLLADEPVPQSDLGLLLYSFGIRSKSDPKKEFAQPKNFLQFACNLKVRAVQLPLGIREKKECFEIQGDAEKNNIQIEGIIAPPQDTIKDRERFQAEIQTAQNCGAKILRMVMLGGRRYEVFRTADEYQTFAKQARIALEQAEKVAAKNQRQLAIENHKDFRIDELLELIQSVSSEWIGICLDTGNNLALLEDSLKTASKLASLTRTVHLKDIAFEESAEGFRMSEVPLGRGCLDLQTIVKTIRKANPKVIFHLEMITRDPLLIPCLQEKYWETMERVPGRELARTLVYVRKHAVTKPLPRLSQMDLPEQIELEYRHVKESLIYATKSRLLDD